MKYLLAGLGAYSVAVGSWFFIANQTPVSLLLGWGLGSLLLFGSIVLMLTGKGGND